MLGPYLHPWYCTVTTEKLVLGRSDTLTTRSWPFRFYRTTSLQLLPALRSTILTYAFVGSDLIIYLFVVIWHLSGMQPALLTKLEVTSYLLLCHTFYKVLQGSWCRIVLKCCGRVNRKQCSGLWEEQSKHSSGVVTSGWVSVIAPCLAAPSVWLSELRYTDRSTSLNVKSAWYEMSPHWTGTPDSIKAAKINKSSSTLDQKDSVAFSLRLLLCPAGRYSTFGSLFFFVAYNL